MHKSKIQNKKSFYLGIALIALGLIFNKRFIEVTVVTDKIIESFSYSLIIILFEIISVIIGTYLVMKQPAIRMPSKRELFLSCLSISIALLMLEIGARIWLNFLATSEQWQKYVLYSELSPGELPWSKHHYLNYYPTPNYKLGLTSQNSSGFRNREFSSEKPPGVYRIAVLGGSTTYDIAVEDNDKTFTSQLEKILRNTYGYKSVEVINAGLDGYTSWESLINLEFRILDIDPDLVLIHPGSDDVHARLVSPAAYRGDNSGSRKQWEPPAVRFFERSCLLRILSRDLGITYPANIQSFVTASSYKGACSADYDQNISDASSKELLRKNPPVYFRRNLQNMTAIAKVQNIKIIFSTFAYSPYFNDYASTPHYREGFTENDNIINEVAHSENIPLFDFAKVMSRESRYWADSCHVNEEGALLKARLFADFIHELNLIPR
jgi:lysophospholipase L1-like esterase